MSLTTVNYFPPHKKQRFSGDKDQTVDKFCENVLFGVDGEDTNTVGNNKMATDTSNNIVVKLEAANNLDNNSNGQFLVHMNITEPLSYLKHLLENRTNIDMAYYTIWLTDWQMLKEDETLIPHCVQKEGLVQITAEILNDLPKGPRLNITDVFKPGYDIEKVLESQFFSDLLDTPLTSTATAESSCTPVSSPVDPNNKNKNKNSQNKITKWKADFNFTRSRRKKGIPNDPNKWGADEVKFWLKWATCKFNLHGIQEEQWQLNGHEICNMTRQKFLQVVPSDPNFLFWSHLQILKKFKFVAVLDESDNEEKSKNRDVFKTKKSCTNTKLLQTGFNYEGATQLWRFLLELLTDKEYSSIIKWTGRNGEFILIDPETVAKLWGIKKNKPYMNYEKMSRGLRYYYAAGIIAKLTDRYAYKFVCDLKNLLGYTSAELKDLIESHLSM